MANKVALITGAGSGLGEATALRFAEEGARVIATDLNGDAATRVAEAGVNRGGKATSRQQDVVDEALWATLMSEIMETFGKLDVLVNNAGISWQATVEQTSLDDWKRVIDVNLTSIFLGTRAAIEVMKETGGGSIINVSSILGIVGEAHAAAYNASKGAVRLFSKSAALQCAQAGNGIRVNSLHPGYIESPMTSGKSDEQKAAARSMISKIPMGAMGQPVDIANGCLFLASDESKYVTGTELIIDGGYTAQ